MTTTMHMELDILQHFLELAIYLTEAINYDKTDHMSV